MSVEPLRSVRDHLSETIDRVERQRERVTITRHGRAAAVLVSPDDLGSLEETLSALLDPDALADIREADAAYAGGDIVRGVEAVRDLLRGNSPYRAPPRRLSQLINAIGLCCANQACVRCRLSK